MTTNIRNFEATQFLGELEHAGSRFRSAYQAELRPLRITPAEAGVLLVLDSAQENPSLGEIGAQLPSETPPSRLMARLVGAGLVAESRDPNDRRVWRFSLTKDGVRTVREIRKVRDDFAATVGVHATATQLRGTNKLLEQLVW